MAIATDIEVNWINTIDLTNKIGLSKPFSELSSDIWSDDSAYVTAFNNVTAKFVKVSDGYPTCPAKSDNCPWYLTGGIGYSNISNNSDSVYLRSAIICVPDDFTYDNWNGNQGGRIRDNINNFRVVTSMSIQKNGISVNLTKQPNGAVTASEYVVKETISGSGSNGGIEIGAGTYKLIIVDIYTSDGNYFLNVPYSYPGYVYDTNNGDGVMGMWAYDSSVNKMFSISPQIFPTDDGRISITGGAVYNVNSWSHHELPDVSGDANLKMYASYVPWNWYLRVEGNTHYHLLNVSRYGLKFTYDGNNYKPVITQGVVTGYTTDMTVPSDIDNWTDISGHNISPIPPSPVPGGDKIDDMNVNPLWAMSSDAGFARYFLMSNDQIGSLQTWLSDTTFPDGYDPYPYIISLLQFPLKLSPDYCMPRTPSGHIVIGGEDTGITASLIANEKAWKGLGTYDVPRENGNFLDYSPYSQYEVYIPCAGWVTCPDIIAGRKIAVKINYDLTTAAIIGNVYVTIDGKEMIVASKSGMMGRETIVSGDAAGVRSAQITSALLSAGTGALNVATGAMSGNAVAAVSGGYHVVAGLAQANIAANSSYARTVGSTGGRALLCQYDKCYLKICTTDADIPAGYGHTVGYICNKSGKVSDFRGYTVFDNFDVTGITGLTQRELMEVKRIMESGVYINSPPE